MGILNFFKKIFERIKDKEYRYTVLQLLNCMESEKCIKHEIPLHDAAGNETSILYELIDNGYVIVDKATNEVTEFSLTSRCKYYKNRDKHYIYAGPLRYYESLEEGKCVELTTNSVENIEDLQEKIVKAKNKYIKKQSKFKTSKKKQASKEAFKDKKVPGKIPNLDYNPNGICGSCASGNLLAYMFYNVDKAYLKKELVEGEDVKGVELIKSLVPYIEGKESLDRGVDSNGSTEDMLLEGLKLYLSECGINEKLKKVM